MHTVHHTRNVKGGSVGETVDDESHGHTGFDHHHLGLQDKNKAKIAEVDVVGVEHTFYKQWHIPLFPWAVLHCTMPSCLCKQCCLKEDICVELQ